MGSTQGNAASGLLPIAGAWSASALVSGQRAGKNLDSSEKFSLGGAEGVRACPQGEAAADEGYLATAELRYALSSLGNAMLHAQMSGFIDTGTVRINHAPFATGDNHRHLSAIGVGINWAIPSDFLFKASIALKVGHASATSDSDRRARAWLQAVKYF